MMRHNKKSNTSLIFELLVKHYTKLMLEGKEDKSQELFKILLKYFSPSSPLAEELSLCNMLLKTPINSFETGSRLLSEAKTACSYLDENKIKEMKFNLLLEIYEQIGKDFFSLPIKDYKKHATVHQLINDYKGNVKIKNIADRITLEEEVISNLIDGEFLNEGKKIVKQDSRTRLAERLAYKLYDDKYSNYFSDDERIIINEYLTNGDFVNFAKQKLQEMKQYLSTANYLKDENVKNKLKEAVKKIEEVSLLEDKSELAYNLILYQELVNEIKNMGN